MNRGALHALDGATLVNGVTSDVDDTAKGARADRDLNGRAGVVGGSTTGQTLGTWEKVRMDSELQMQKEPTIHSNSTDDILTQMLLFGVSEPRQVDVMGAGGQHTATSSTSFWPWFSVSMALRIEGSFSPSNLTAEKSDTAN